MSDIPIKLDAKSIEELQTQLLAIFRDLYEERVVTEFGVLTPLYFVYVDATGNLRSSAISTSMLTGTNTGNQTITLTGDVTGSGTASFAATIASDAVTYAKMQNVSDTDKILGRQTAGIGNVEEIACTAWGRALLDDTSEAAQRTTLGLGSIAIQAANNVSITGGTISGIPNSAISRVSTQFDKTDITLANVTGLTANIVSGCAYAFRAVLFVDASAVGGSRYSISGTGTASAIIYHVMLVDDTLNTCTITKRETALGANNATQAGTTVGKCIIEGVLTANGTGALTVQFAQSVSNGTSSVLVGSTFTVDKIA